MDPLSDVLSLLKPRTYVTGALSAGDPWALQLPAYEGIKCYMVVEGTCWLAIEDEPSARLHQGDCLLLPHGKPFVIASDLDLPAVDARKIVSEKARYQGVLPVTPGEWSARLEMCQWIRETLDKESVWDVGKSTSLSR